MNFAIAVVLLAGVVVVYSELQLGVDANGAENPTKLPPKDLNSINIVVTKSAGPEIAEIVTNFISQIANNASVNARDFYRLILVLLYETLKSHGNETLVTSGMENAGKELTPADKKKLFQILNRTLAPYTSSYIVRFASILVEGLTGKLNPKKLFEALAGLAKKSKAAVTEEDILIPRNPALNIN